MSKFREWPWLYVSAAVFFFIVVILASAALTTILASKPPVVLEHRLTFFQQVPQVNYLPLVHRVDPLAECIDRLGALEMAGNP